MTREEDEDDDDLGLVTVPLKLKLGMNLCIKTTLSRHIVEDGRPLGMLMTAVNRHRRLRR